MVTEENNIAKSYRSKKITIFFLWGLVILVSGIIIGAGATVLMVKQRIIWINKPSKDANEITQMISEKYGLSEQQTQQVQQVFDKAFQKRKQYVQEQDQRRETDTQTMITEMNSILTPEQFEKWNKDFQIMQEKFKKRFKK
ncbi:MAG: hypothetical protein WC496_03665 [Phycisphaerae bacterium]|jgi:molecular chaperone DnaK (HSP70)